MIYIYDIYVNLNDNYYDFYEWNENDILEHIRKMPLLRVNKKMINKILEKNIIINKNFLNTIYNKCEIFDNKSINYIEYASIFSDGEKSVVVSFNKKGYIVELSSIEVSEELEILDIVDTMIEKDIKFKELNKKCERINFTRKELKLINTILFELDKIKDDSLKIQYLYYEWFGHDKNISYEKLINDIKKEFNSKHIEFIELLKLLV